MAEKQSRKSKRGFTKKSSAEELVCSLNIVIIITRIGNLKNPENGEEAEFEISLKCMAKFLNCKNVDNLSEETNRFKIIGNYDEESVNLEFKLQINLKNEDIFQLAGYPAELSLIQHHKDSQKSILGFSNLDFYPLITSQVEKRVFHLHFERDENPDNQLPLIRKPCIELTVFTNEPIIQEPNTIANSIMITVDSICNMSSSCPSVEVGFIVPFEAQFAKKIIFSNPQHCGNNKKWFNLSHIYGKGGESTFIETFSKYHLKKEEKEMLKNITIKDTIQFNSIARAILSLESVIFLYDHIRRNKKLAVEVTVEGKHLIGFIDLEELVHINRKKLHTVVPLTQFNEISLLEICDYPSAFEGLFESKKSSILKKSISLKKLQNTKCSTADVTKIGTPEIICNADGNPTFIILEIEFEKPLNKEVLVEIDILHTKNPGTSIEQDMKSKLKDNIRKKIKEQTKNLLKVYEQEGDLENIFNRMVNDGFVGKILDSLAVDICKITKEQFCSFTSNNDVENLLSTLMCDVTSAVLNEPKIKADYQQNRMLAKIYHDLNIDERSNEVYLRLLFDENCSEASWISYGIHNLRSLKFNEAYVCFEEGLETNDKSLLGNILKAYLSFIQQKYNECDRLLNFVMHLNPGLLEVEFMKHLLNVKLSREEIPVHMKEFKYHQEFDEIYNEQEFLWFSTPNESFLNFQNNFVKFAIFCIKLGCYEYAELVLAEYFLNFGANVNYLYLMAVIDAMRDEYENALIHLNKISKMDIGNHAVNYEKIKIFIAVMLMKLGKFSSAEKLFVNGIKLTATTKIEHVLVLLQLGIYYKDQELFHRAEELLIVAVKILPFDLSFLELGKCYHSLNKLSFAEKCFYTAINMNDKQDQAWKELSIIFNQRPKMNEFFIQNKL